MTWHRIEEQQPEPDDLVLIAFLRPKDGGDLVYEVATYGHFEEEGDTHYFYFGISDAIYEKNILAWAKFDKFR